MGKVIADVLWNLRGTILLLAVVSPILFGIYVYNKMTCIQSQIDTNNAFVGVILSMGTPRFNAEMVNLGNKFLVQEKACKLINSIESGTSDSEL